MFRHFEIRARDMKPSTFPLLQLRAYHASQRVRWLCLGLGQDAGNGFLHVFPVCHVGSRPEALKHFIRYKREGGTLRRQARELEEGEVFWVLSPPKPSFGPSVSCLGFRAQPSTSWQALI